jgi:hypothetical protein
MGHFRAAGDERAQTAGEKGRCWAGFGHRPDRCRRAARLRLECRGSGRTTRIPVCSRTRSLCRRRRRAGRRSGLGTDDARGQYLGRRQRAWPLSGGDCPASRREYGQPERPEWPEWPGQPRLRAGFRTARARRVHDGCELRAHDLSDFRPIGAASRQARDRGQGSGAGSTPRHQPPRPAGAGWRQDQGRAHARLAAPHDRRTVPGGMAAPAGCRICRASREGAPRRRPGAPRRRPIA